MSDEPADDRQSASDGGSTAEPVPGAPDDRAAGGEAGAVAPVDEATRAPGTRTIETDEDAVARGAVRLLRLSAAAGALVWLVAAFIPGTGNAPLQRLLALGALVIAPLAFAQVPARARGATLRGGVALLTLPAAVLVLVSLRLRPGLLAGTLASFWLGLTGLAAIWGLTHLGGQGRSPAARVGTVAALLFLPVGGAWLVASRLGLHPFHYDPLVVMLTAVHFHYAGLAAPMLAARNADAMAERGPALRGLAAVPVVGVVVGVPLVAAGIAGSPALALVGAAVLTTGLAVFAGLLLAAVPRIDGWPARVLLALSSLAVLAGMALAVTWSWGQLTHTTPVRLDTMIDLHGRLQAFGFALCGLLAFTLVDLRAPRLRA